LVRRLTLTKLAFEEPEPGDRWLREKGVVFRRTGPFPVTDVFTIPLIPTNSPRYFNPAPVRYLWCRREYIVRKVRTICSRFMAAKHKRNLEFGAQNTNTISVYRCEDANLREDPNGKDHHLGGGAFGLHR
jgi:hypothetical protein